MTDVSDAGPIIAFASMARLDLLEAIFGQVTISSTVASEIRPSDPLLPDWIIVAEAPPSPATPPMRSNLDAGNDRR